MSFKIAILICFALMLFIACVTYYLGKKVSKSLMKYIPVFSFGVGMLFFYIKLNFISYKPNSFDSIYDMIVFIILIIVCSIAFLEAVIIDIVENTALFNKGFMIIRKLMKLEGMKKAVKFKRPGEIVKKIRGVYRAD
ncbi:hypothetical protein [Bacillus sp. FJAT-22090]|uniref:hypothetical protein n=1 Tax=Bacillus sp. FJAT-22090 TaxID=1581038 RepID=UPI00119EE18A|nr:hypothetical protein [Bacillus sp. FJAT-22090]